MAKLPYHPHSPYVLRDSFPLDTVFLYARDGERIPFPAPERNTTAMNIRVKVTPELRAQLAVAFPEEAKLLDSLGTLDLRFSSAADDDPGRKVVIDCNAVSPVPPRSAFERDINGRPTLTLPFDGEVRRLIRESLKFPAEPAEGSDAQ